MTRGERVEDMELVAGVIALYERAQTRCVRILLHSSNDEHALRAAARRLEIDGYVPKGDPGELRRKVADVLRSGRGRAR